MNSWMTEHIHCSYPLISWPLVVRAGFSWVGGTRVSPGLNVSLRPVRRGILLWMELFLAVEEEEEEEEVCDELSFLGIVERVGVELICKTHTKVQFLVFFVAGCMEHFKSYTSNQIWWWMKHYNGTCDGTSLFCDTMQSSFFFIKIMLMKKNVLNLSDLEGIYVWYQKSLIWFDHLGISKHHLLSLDTLSYKRRSLKLMKPLYNIGENYGSRELVIHLPPMGSIQYTHTILLVYVVVTDIYVYTSLCFRHHITPSQFIE